MDFGGAKEKVCDLTRTDPALILAEESLEYCMPWEGERSYTALQRDWKFRKGFKFPRGAGE